MSLYTGVPGYERWLPYEKVKAAHVLYRSGMSIPQIAEYVYAQYGYNNARSCAHSLQRAFHQLGFKVRNADEARRVRARHQTCKGCGVHVDERTRGCHGCNRRHWERQVEGLTFTPSVGRENCGGCGCPLAERTRGCNACCGRHRKWMLAGRPYVPRTTVGCSGCGIALEEKTPRCRQCYGRHYRRRSSRASAAPPPALRTAESPGGGTTLERSAA